MKCFSTLKSFAFSFLLSHVLSIRRSTAVKMYPLIFSPVTYVYRKNYIGFIISMLMASMRLGSPSKNLPPT